MICLQRSPPTIPPEACKCYCEGMYWVCSQPALNFFFNLLENFQVYDEGQYGIGYNANELQPQVDCLGEVHFIDGVVHDESGQPRRVPRAICIHEEDAGILWKHTDFRTGRNLVVRSQRLAFTFIATVGNYDYIYSWNFYQDGTIEFNVKPTGILSVHLLAIGSTPAGHGTVVAPQINAQYHQHFFALRLDAEIDGNQNTVAISDVVPLDGKRKKSELKYKSKIFL